MAINPPELLPVRPTRLAIVGTYPGRTRFGSALCGIPSIKVIGLVDSDSRAGRGWARELPGKPTAYTTVERLLDAQAEVDGAIVACALPERAPAIDVLASAGIPILTEFPYTVTLAAMDRLIEVADSARSRIVPALPYRFEPASNEIARALEKGIAGSITRVRCEVSFPLGASYALENGVAPVSIDWYDLLQVVACRTIDQCITWLGKPESINADIDLPHHAALAGRRTSDPVANLIISHERGQSTHLLRLSRSVQPTERYLLSGEHGSIEQVICEGEKLATGPMVRVHLAGAKPETIYSAETHASELTTASIKMLSEFTASIQFSTAASNPSSSLTARMALETVHAAFASARDGIRTRLPLVEPVDVDAILQSG